MGYIYLLIGGILVLAGVLSQKLADKKALSLIEKELENKQTLINQFADLSVQLATANQSQESIRMPFPIPPKQEEEEPQGDMFASETGGQN